MKCVTAFVVAALASTLTGGCASERTASSNTGPAIGCCCAVPAGTTAAVDAKTAEALRAALQDERRAQAFYTNVMAKHGQVRPFSNIVQAEERHADTVTTLMERHGVTVPPAQLAEVPAVPGTLRECNTVAAKLERDNIGMYDRLLNDVKEPDIRTAFENLRAASQNNHLPAFERWSANSRSGRGYGSPRAGGPGLGIACAGVCTGPCAAAQ